MRRLFTKFLTLIKCFTYAQQASNSFIKNEIDKVLKKENTNIEFEITSKSQSGNVSYYYGIQTFKNFPIVGSEFNFVICEQKVVKFNHKFIVNPEKNNQINVYHHSAAQVLQKLVADYPIDKSKVREVRVGEYHYVNQMLSDEPIKIFKKWYLDEDKLIPVFEVSLYEKDHSHWYNTLVDATNNGIIKRIDWVNHCNTSPAVYQNIYRNDAPIVTEKELVHASSGYRVFARPIESPRHGNRSLEEDPSNDDASPYGWHDINGSAGAEFTITRGNNVLASEDKNADNSAGYSPDGGSSLTFDYDFDITKSAALYTDAAITNLFYWNNLMHDVWWHYGFDEESGNFQQNNYGRGGIGGDYVNADAQDGSGQNNANFATPPDGQNPRMQMYIWSASNSGDYFQVNSPGFASGKYLSNIAGFGPSLTTTPIVGDLVLINSGGSNSKDGCNTVQNSAALNGKIALIERGSCTFVEKVKNAQNAGAIAVVIYNNVTTNPTRMGGTDNSITIPSVMIKKNDGEYLLGLLSSQTVSVSLYDSSFAAANTFDSDFDNGVISHEYGHGISVRLTGGASNSSCLANEEQMGEGWSDFFALVMTHQPGDKASDIRGIGTYVSNEPTNGDGIRNYPYSTDLSKSPYTYNNIKSFSVPHGVGSVWCAMLWDMYWAFIDTYGYDSDIYEGTGGNNMAMQLVIDGLKLQPCGPGFVDGRDAILLADRLRNGGANQELIWNVFARRGLGYDASQGSSTSRSDGVSAFNLPPYLKGELVIQKTAPTQSINNEQLNYKISIVNYNSFTINSVSLSDTLDPQVTLLTESLSCGATYSGGIISINLDSLEANDSFICTYAVVPKLHKTSVVIWEDDVENGNNQWQSNSDLGSSGWIISTNRKNSGEKSWFVPNENTSSDYSLNGSIEVSGKSPVLSFAHRYLTEELWDGGVVEYKTATSGWVDAEDLFLLNGYNSVISTNPQSRLSGRKAFTGDSKVFIESKLDLSSFVGSTIDVRFRFASDGAASEEGWYIDDIRLEDAVSIDNFVTATYADKVGRAGTKTFISGEGISASIQDVDSESKLSVFPNPTENTVNIYWKEAAFLNVKLMDINGRVLRIIDGSEQVVLSVKDYASGVYMLEISNSTEIVRRRLIKK